MKLNQFKVGDRVRLSHFSSHQYWEIKCLGYEKVFVRGENGDEVLLGYDIQGWELYRPEPPKEQEFEEITLSEWLTRGMRVQPSTIEPMKVVLKNGKVKTYDGTEITIADTEAYFFIKVPKKEGGKK